VVAGYWVMTPSSGTELERLVQLGLMTKSGGLGPEELRRAVERLAPDAALVRRDASGFKWWTEASGYERVAEWNDRVLLLRHSEPPT